jgi:hypothetical protein
MTPTGGMCYYKVFSLPSDVHWLSSCMLPASVRLRPVR